MLFFIPKINWLLCIYYLLWRLPTLRQITEICYNWIRLESIVKLIQKTECYALDSDCVKFDLCLLDKRTVIKITKELGISVKWEKSYQSQQEKNSWKRYASPFTTDAIYPPIVSFIMPMKSSTRRWKYIPGFIHVVFHTKK